MTDQPGSGNPPGNPPAANPPGNEPPAFDWKTSLGDQYGAHEALLTAKGWKGPADVLGSYAGLEKLMGQDKIAIPGKDAKPEDWDGVWKKLGRPEKPDGYQFQKPEGFDGYDDAFAGAYRDAAHKAGLTPRQAAALHDWWVGNAKDGAGKHAEAVKARDEEVKTQIAKEWGDNAPAKMEAVRKAAQQLGADDAALAAIEGGLGNFAALKLLAMLGEQAGEGDLKGSQAKVDDAKTQIARLEADPEAMKALLDPNHPQHDETLKRKNALYAAAYG